MDDLEDFGSALRALRTGEGWRQQDLVDRLEAGIARSTLANVERGREAPSERLWALLGTHLPAWADRLEPAYRAARADVDDARQRPRRTRAAQRLPVSGEQRQHVLAGPFVIEQLHYVYTFRHSRTPEEIVEVRRVRATKAATGYGLKFQHMDSDEFEIETEPLWGGAIGIDQRHTTQGPEGAGTLLLATFEFDRPMRRGDVHEFALRHWIDRDPDPATEVLFTTTLPTRHAAVTLNFHGPHTPQAAWTFGPLADDVLVPHDVDAPHAVPVPMSTSLSAHFPSPVPGATSGIAWRW